MHRSHSTLLCPKRASAAGGLTLLLAGLLAACGGGDSSSTTAAASPAPAASAATTSPTTTVSGAVVKGPVLGAQVCAFAVAGSVRGAALGACTTTDAAGHYSLSVPAGTGALWLQASGGSYTDEATAVATTLAAGTPLLSLVNANGALVSAMLTPLTTLAFNTARAAAAANGATLALDAAAFEAAAAQWRSSLQLPSGLDLNSTLPGFGTAANAYGDALANISRMVAAGTPLADLLANNQPAAFAAAYSAAYAAYAAALAAATAPVTSPVITPVTTPPVVADTTGTTTTRGTITSDNAAVATFSPTASGARKVKAFTTVIGSNSAQYFFTNSLQGTDATGSSAGVATQQFLFSTLNGVPSGVSFIETTFDRGIARRLWRDCALPCAGFSMARTANGQGMTFTLDNSRLQTNALLSTVASPPTTAVVFQGSVTGEIAGGYVLSSQLPRATNGSLTLDGVAVPVLYSSVDYPYLRDAQPALYPSITLNTAQGLFRVNVLPDQAADRSHGLLYITNAQVVYSANLSPAALATSAGGYTLTLNNQAISTGGSTAKLASVVAAISVGRPTGVLSISGEADFKPLSGTTSGASEQLIYSFRGLTPASASTQPSVTVTLAQGKVVSFMATAANGKAYTCDDTGSLFISRCGGTVSVSADGRSLQFTNFMAGPNLSAVASVGFNGALTASGD